MTANPPDDQLALPGLELSEPRESDSPMVVAAKLTLAELQRTGAVELRHAVQVQLVLQLAQSIDAGTRSGRASAVAMAAAQLRETMLVLDPPDDMANATMRQRLDAFMDSIERAANSGAEQ